jgi:hypothetical protein
MVIPSPKTLYDEIGGFEMTCNIMGLYSPAEIQEFLEMYQEPAKIRAIADVVDADVASKIQDFEDCIEPEPLDDLARFMDEADLGALSLDEKFESAADAAMEDVAERINPPLPQGSLRSILKSPRTLTPTFFWNSTGSVFG